MCDGKRWRLVQQIREYRVRWGLIRDLKWKETVSLFTCRWGSISFYTHTFLCRSRPFTFWRRADDGGRGHRLGWGERGWDNWCWAYSGRGLLGVICLLACSSSWSAVRKALTLSKVGEKVEPGQMDLTQTWLLICRHCCHLYCNVSRKTCFWKVLKVHCKNTGLIYKCYIGKRLIFCWWKH